MFFKCAHRCWKVNQRVQRGSHLGGWWLFGEKSGGELLGEEQKETLEQQGRGNSTRGGGGHL